MRDRARLATQTASERQAGKVRERRETKPPKRRGTRLEQMRDRLAVKSFEERLKMITADKDQPARKVSS